MRRPFLCACLSLCFGFCVLACGPGSSDDDDVIDASVVDTRDADGDGISDTDEGRSDNVDTDDDNIPDYLDEDSDDDGIPDYREAGDTLIDTPPVDSDNDDIPDFRDTDSDNNGRADGVDGVEDMDGDGLGNFCDKDDDGDGINDEIEIRGTPEQPPDTDNDGAYDFQDTDSDSDTIGDVYEGLGDFDEDTLPAYLDPESDGDCVSDVKEAGDQDPTTPPVDTDEDGQFDFLDLDSDNDGLPDNLEDSNCNGIADNGESSRVDADSDDDGVSDLIESAAGTDPNDDTDNPRANGDFVFVVPYGMDPQPLADNLDFATDIVQADVVFGMDTTSSMGGEIDNLKSGIAGLISTIRSNIPNTAFAVVGYDDFPTDSYGSAAYGDQPFYLVHRVMTTSTGAGLSSVQNAVNSYTIHGGSDGPESGWEFLYQTATGEGTSEGSATVPAFDPAVGPPATAPTGEEIGDIGGVGFREGSLPIIVWATDACSHNSVTGTANDYSGFTAANETTALSAANALSARLVSVISEEFSACSSEDIIGQAQAAVTATNSVVPPDAWGPIGVRPGSCNLTECCTGQNGNGQPTVGGSCPLVFRVNSSGAGLSGTVATAIDVLTTFGAFDISGVPQDDPTDAVDTLSAFVSRIEATATAGAPCANGIPVTDVNSDGVDDTFPDVHPGLTVCFEVVPKMNATVLPTDTPQMFKAEIVVYGDQITVLGKRTVYFLVPPEIEDIPID